jgi:hypothetical protein
VAVDHNARDVALDYRLHHDSAVSNDPVEPGSAQRHCHIAGEHERQTAGQGGTLDPHDRRSDPAPA